MTRSYVAAPFRIYGPALAANRCRRAAVAAGIVFLGTLACLALELAR
jgi:hypothetical protein